MATQSLYRRYRPRRFSEVKGQEHVVRALRTSVADGRAGQAYLFSGPRGTGKTTSARILAKVLNCTNPQDGEPCCECESCLAVERGTSYDVHELDAASNNGVDAMRDLIDKASLGTPGRHKVYILDEVHMLSNAAEAALLKTLEEPPSHVVFVLATTDPQKMSDTVRSRTQHLQFHLLPPDTLADHVRWVATDAGLDVDDDAVASVLARGGGSARDTLSALELVANSGGAAGAVVDAGVLVEAMADRDPGAALTFVAGAVSKGFDPRALSDEIVEHFRNCFLALMAPDLVLLPSERVTALSEQARRLGPAGIVRGIEVFGSILVEMRHAPNPRVLVDVAVVQLTSDAAAADLAGLAARLDRLERTVAEGVPVLAAAAPAPAPAPAAAPSAESAQVVEPAAAPAKRASIGSRARRAADTATNESGADESGTNEPADAAPPSSAPAAGAVGGSPAENSPAAASAPAAVPAGGPLPGDVWAEVRPKLRGLARPLYTSTELVTSDSSSITLRAPSTAHQSKCEQHKAPVEKAFTERLGRPIAVHLITDSGGGGSNGGGPSNGPAGGPAGGGSAQPASAPATPQPAPSIGPGSGSGSAGTPDDVPADHPAHPGSAQNAEPEYIPHPAGDTSVDASSGSAPIDARGASAPAPSEPGGSVVTPLRAAEPSANGHAEVDPSPVVLPTDDEVDLDDLVDAPPETYKSPMDRLAEAFPGSELVERRD